MENISFRFKKKGEKMDSFKFLTTKSLKRNSHILHFVTLFKNIYGVQKINSV